MKVYDDDGTEMEKCNSCGYFGDHVGRLMIECCNGSSGCGCHGEAMDIGQCRVCFGTGWRRKDADPKGNMPTVRALCEATGGYPGGGPRFGR